MEGEIIRWIAGARHSKASADEWGAHMVSYTEAELKNMPRQNRDPQAVDTAEGHKTSGRQRLTQAQQASVLTERALAAKQRVERGWEAPGLRVTPLQLWHADE